MGGTSTKGENLMVKREEVKSGPLVTRIDPTLTQRDIDGEPDYISIYTRAQALEDGTLIDVTADAKEAGFKYPVAITAAVMAQVVRPYGVAKEWGESEKGRIWDVLWMLRTAIRSWQPPANSDICRFNVIATDEKGKSVRHELWSQCGPGDDPAPVITIMMRGED